jgi:hypothetical protein
MLNQFIGLPGLSILLKSLGDVLPANHSEGDPAYLSKSALDICMAQGWADHGELLAKGIACAQKYWNREASDDERQRMQMALFDQSRLEQSQHGKESPEASRYSLVVWSLDAITSSSAFASDYLVEAALRAGVSLEDLRVALERNVPGLTAALADRGVKAAATTSTGS